MGQCLSLRGGPSTKLKFPKLAIVAKNVFCIPATSANCERAFSTLTDVVTKKRNRLKAKTTHMLTFCKHNLSLIPEYNSITSDIEFPDESMKTDELENISENEDWTY